VEERGVAGAFPPPPQGGRPRILFVWEKFGPYHMDRCEACAQRLGASFEVLGLEIASHGVYQWDPTGPGRAFSKLTLFPGRHSEQLGQWRYFRAMLRAALSSRARHVFLCGYQYPPVFFAALALRLMGRKVIVMNESKFDDKERRIPLECLKVLLYRPYHAALIGAPRAAAYLEFLGVPPERMALGYDTVSLERVRALAKSPPAPQGVAHGARHFTIIARFVPEKNLAFALAAYARYREIAGANPRELHICGSGPLEAELKDLVARQRIAGVRFLGFIQEDGIARTLASSLALLLPSVEEPFGLVVNEALAVGVPAIVSTNCGARDLLVRNGVNGFVVEPDNLEGLAQVMARLDREPEEWARLAQNTRRFWGVADTTAFAEGVERLLETLPA
jgi:glycosyltransferase involved in cell wall biosynthesis